MFPQLSRPRTTTARINALPVLVEPRETVLQAALRSGVNFPNSCRVGGCGACRCRLAEGSVQELTETAYLLSREEIAEGYILACQSVPRGDISVEVELAARRVVTVTAQERLTHDITHLRAMCDEPIAYRSGQFATLTLDGVSRSYSFAAPPSPDGALSFFVRRTPGGQLSPRLCDENLIGQSLTLEGPSGDFWLRDSDAPALFVAGGSGLAPILAMLRQAAREGVARPVTLLFGARTAADLYALDEIDALARAWSGGFTFIPVLSESDDPEWTGARGLVTAHLSAHIPAGAHAYLCGPPAMVDAAAELLTQHGVSRENIRCDRFTTQGDAPVTPVTPEAAGALHYLKFFMFHAVGALSAVALLVGGRFVTAGLLAVLALYMVGDAVCGDDSSTPTYRHPWVLTAQLWMALPLLALIVFAAVWSVSPGDPLGFGAWLSSLAGYDLFAAREATSLGHHLSGWVLTGLMIGMVGTIPAHELTHRTWDKVSMLIGRWLLAFSFDASFAVEHVYGHHRYVSTEIDPATAPRGRSVYTHIVISSIKGNLSAWHIEKERLAKRGLSVWSPQNAVIRGYLMSVALVAAAFAMGGARAALFFTACALWGKALLEIVNYMEHYGMVRDPATPVQPRHSWNTNRRISSWSMFNLTRHSHHHAQGEVAYQDLRPFPDAPMMLNGYLTTLVIAMIPPLWHHLMTPKLLQWDRDFATETERRLAARASARAHRPSKARFLAGFILPSHK